VRGRGGAAAVPVGRRARARPPACPPPFLLPPSVPPDYGRLIAYYTEGGFTDEAGRFHAGHNLTFSHWEVLNEVNSEHHMTPAFYTFCYDAIIAGIRRWAPNGSKNLKFFGIGGAGPSYVQYFLTRANHHPPDTPIDFISLHHYAGAAHRDGGNATPGGDYEAFFPSGDGFIGELVGAYANIAASDYPHVMIDADEVGVILPDDNDPIFTATAPGFPAVYWNAAAAMYAYLFGRSATIGLDVLGESQLIGYPSIPFARGPPYNGPWTAPPQYPSVSMLSWGGAFGEQGDGTARYFVLKMLIDEMRAGPPAGTFAPAEADWLVNTSVTGGGSAPLTSPFCAEELNLSTLSMFCASGVINGITFASYGTPTGSCGSWAVNASCNAANSTAIVSAACLGKEFCSVKADTPTFGDPCCACARRRCLLLPPSFARRAPAYFPTARPAPARSPAAPTPTRGRAQSTSSSTSPSRRRAAAAAARRSGPRASMRRRL
jgi:hypothetical protein